MDYIEKIYYLNHAIEQAYFLRAKKYLFIVSIIFICLIFISIIFKDIKNMNNTKRLIKILLVIFLIGEISVISNLCYRYYYIYQYDNHKDDWEVRILEKSIKEIENNK